MEINYYKMCGHDAEEELLESISLLQEKNFKQILKKLSYLESKGLQENKQSKDLVNIITVGEKLLELKLKTFIPYRLISMVDLTNQSGILVLDFLIKKYDGVIKKKDLNRAIGRYYEVINK